MASEVLLHGRLLAVGEPKPLVRDLVIPGNIGRILECADTSVRPARWESVKQQRVQLRELEDRLVKHRDHYKLVSRATMEAEVHNCSHRRIYISIIYNI